MKMTTRLAMVLVALVALCACEREERRFRETPATADTVNSIQMGSLQPGSAGPPPSRDNPYEENAFAVSEGKRLFTWFNCIGCHAHGGGGMAPALMDEKWIYGSEPAQIFSTIVEGRPNGMPSFRGKIPDYQVWQIVAYVRSMAGLVRKDVSSGRDDHMSGRPGEQNLPAETPVSSLVPKSAEAPK